MPATQPGHAVVVNTYQPFSVPNFNGEKRVSAGSPAPAPTSVTDTVCAVMVPLWNSSTATAVQKNVMSSTKPVDAVTDAELAKVKTATSILGEAIKNLSKVVEGARDVMKKQINIHEKECVNLQKVDDAIATLACEKVKAAFASAKAEIEKETIIHTSNAETLKNLRKEYASKKVLNNVLQELGLGSVSKKHKKEPQT